MAEEYERILEEVRRVPGFEGFLRPRKWEDLVRGEVLQSRCVVIVNSCSALTPPSVPHAIIIRRQSADCGDSSSSDTGDVYVGLIELPTFSYEKAVKMHSRLLDCLKRNGVLVRNTESRAGRPSGGVNDTQRLFCEILGDLWRDVVGPVLYVLGFLVCPLLFRRS